MRKGKSNKHKCAMPDYYPLENRWNEKMMKLLCGANREDSNHEIGNTSVPVGRRSQTIMSDVDNRSDSRWCDSDVDMRKSSGEDLSNDAENLGDPDIKINKVVSAKDLKISTLNMNIKKLERVCENRKKESQGIGGALSRVNALLKE